MAQVAIGLIRQHLDPGNQVHGIVEKGGDAPNIVPKEATGRWMIRARSLEDLARLRPRIERCFEAGALATGATLEITRPLPHLLPLRGRPRPHRHLAGQRRGARPALRRPTRTARPRPPSRPTWPTSPWPSPSIHPMIGIDAHGAVNHQPEFAAACVGPSAEPALLDGAVAMAWTAIDAATDPALRDGLLASRS